MRRDAYYYYFVKKKKNPRLEKCYILGPEDHRNLSMGISYTQNTLASSYRINTQVLLG